MICWFNSCRSDGSVLSPHHRLWPHCEALRTCTVTGDREDAERIATRIFQFFAARPFAAGWIDRFDDRLTPTVATVPTSSIYHLFEAALALVAHGWADAPGAGPC